MIGVKAKEKNRMKNKWRWLQGLLVAIGLGILIFQYVKYRVAPGIAFSDLPLKTVAGAPVHLSDYKGKVVFINFWATWCGDCRVEMPSIENAQAELEKDSVVFLLVTDEAQEKIAAFAENHSYPFHYLLTSKKLGDLGIHALPTTYIIGRDGSIVYTKVGGEQWDTPDMIGRIRDMAK